MRKLNLVPKLKFGRSCGFTTTELMVGVTVFGMIAGSSYLVLNNSARSKRSGDQLAEAQQAGRSAMNSIITDLRRAGYGVDSGSTPPIEVASQYRMTFLIDENKDGTIETGERITYFIDPTQTNTITANTKNPYDHLLRRVKNSATDSLATPGAGKGDVVGYLLTQRSSHSVSTKDTPLFAFFDDNDSDLLGTEFDPAGTPYGLTVPQASLGNGGSMDVDRVQVTAVTETAAPKSGTSAYSRFEIGSTVRPRNFGFDLLSSYTLTGAGGSDPDSSAAPPDTSTTSPPDTSGTEDNEIPPYEPPIRISTARVISMAVDDLGEKDSMEGSAVTVDYQEDMDIALGTKAGSSNNLSVWFNGQPDRYSSETYFQSNPNYYGNSSWDITDIAMGSLTTLNGTEKDVVSAVRVTETSGGFHVWLNQGGTSSGYAGSGSSTTNPNAYYTSSSGSGRAITLVDFDHDGDLDVVLGTQTATKNGELEVWRGDGYGAFWLYQKVVASGAVNDIALVDYNQDGWMDVVAGTKTHNNDRRGKIDVFKNTNGIFFKTVSYDAGGKVNAIATEEMNGDSYVDIVIGTKTGNSAGEIELWKGTGSGFTKADEVSADGIVLCVDLGPIDIDDNYPDVVAGNASQTVQAWFVTRGSGDSALLPGYESWADANAGGEVHAVELAKLEVGSATWGDDPLYDLVIGTEVSSTTGEIVIYMNPYVWTLQQ